LVAPPAPGEALVRTQWSGISRGTERLVWNGLQGSTHRDRMRAPMQEGDFPFPVKYGYCAVGRIEEGPDALLGRTVFCLHPHQDLFVAPADALAVVPEGVPARRATLAANMETALNALWDSGAGPGDRIVIVGAGVVGLLLAMLTARLPGAEVTVADVAAHRGALVAHLGARFAGAEPGVADADVVFHTSGSAAGLATALRCCGLEAALVEMSWSGDAEIAAPLGGEFHSRRIRLLSSQVGQVSPTRRPRWSHARRLAKALELLGDGRLDALVKEEVAFARLPAALPRILGPEADGLAPVVRYAPEHASLTVDLPPI
jgi:threonine dehydrogenase-like Zn-dependent dehydrogenase